MTSKKQKTKQSNTSNEIRDFAQEVYDHVWSKQFFITEGVTEKFKEELRVRNSLKDQLKVTHFTESIGKAVRLSQFLLRDYFSNILEFAIKEKHSFKKEVELMWSHWLDNRTNIFVKVIDTLAIVAEIFLFCDSRKLSNFELSEATEWFVDLFEKNLALEFFKCGGWKQLGELASKWYDDLFEKLKLFMSLYYTPKHSDYLNTIYSCKVIDYIRDSPVKFPVPDSVLCDDCSLPTDQNLHKRTVYVRLAKEFQKIYPRKSDEQHLNISYDAKTEHQLKDYHGPTKSQFKEKLNTKSFPFVKEPQIETQKDLITEISKTNPPYLSSTPSETVAAENISKVNQIVEVSGRAEIPTRPKSALSKDSPLTSALALPLPLSTPHLVKILSTKESLSASQNLPPITFKTKIPTDDNGGVKYIDHVKTLYLNLYESVKYNECIDMIYQLVISQDCQVKSTMDKNKLYLISELFSNSSEEMFEAFCNNSIEEKLRNINILEESVVAVPENLKSEQKPSAELDGIEILACEYRYYFMGGKKKDSSKKSNRRQKSRSNIT